MRFETTRVPHNRHQNVIEDSQNTHPEMHTEPKEIEESSNLGDKADTGKSDKQADRGHKKILGLQEYRNQKENKKKVTKAAGSANN